MIVAKFSMSITFTSSPATNLRHNICFLKEPTNQLLQVKEKVISSSKNAMIHMKTMDNGNCGSELIAVQVKGTTIFGGKSF